MNNYQYPPLMKLSQIRRLEIKRNLYLVQSFREHGASRFYYIGVGVSAFVLFVALMTWADEVEDSIDSEFLGSLSGQVIRIASMIGIGFGVFGLVKSFLVELEILIRQYQQRKQESFLDKQAAYSYSLEDYLHVGDEYLKIYSFRKAHAAYSQAISINPKHWRGYLSRIDCFWLSQKYAVTPRHLAYFVSFPSTEPDETNSAGVRKLVDFAQRVVDREDVFINENGQIILDQSDELQSHYITRYAPLPADLQQLISDCIQCKRNLPDAPSEYHAYRRFRQVIEYHQRELNLEWGSALSRSRKFPWWQHEFFYEIFGQKRRSERDKDENYYRQHLLVGAFSAFYDFFNEVLPEVSYVVQGHYLEPSEADLNTQLEKQNAGANILKGIGCVVIVLIALVVIVIGSAAGIW